jgi:hypothetical protein
MGDRRLSRIRSPIRGAFVLALLALSAQSCIAGVSRKKRLAIPINFPRGFCAQRSMQLVEELGSGLIKRLEKQFRFLLKVQQAELAKDRSSHATESARSNLIALQHTVKQIYGEAVARHVANLVTLTAPA